MNRKMTSFVALILFLVPLCACAHAFPRNIKYVKISNLYKNPEDYKNNLICVVSSLIFDRSLPILVEKNDRIEQRYQLIPKKVNLEEFVDISSSEDLVFKNNENVLSCGRVQFDSECFSDSIKCIPQRIYLDNARIHPLEIQ